MPNIRFNVFVKGILLFLFLPLLLAGCSQIQVSQDYNRNLIPPVLHTYNWTPGFTENGGLKSSDPLLHDRYISAIEFNLASKGYQKTQKPDFYIQYSYQIKTKIQSSPTVSYSIGRSSYSRYSGIGFDSASEIRQYDVGYVFIDFIGRTNNEVFWRGRGSSLISVHSSPENISKRVNQTVFQILQQFPSSR